MLSASLLYFYVCIYIYTYKFIYTCVYKCYNVSFLDIEFNIYLVLEKTGLSAPSKHTSINFLYFSFFYLGCPLYITSLWLGRKKKEKYGDVCIVNIWPNLYCQQYEY